MPRKKRKSSYIRKGALIGGIFGVILIILLFIFEDSIILSIFTLIPSFIGMVLFAIQHFIFQGKLLDPESSILYFIFVIIIIFYVLIGTLIAYLIQRRKK